MKEIFLQIQQRLSDFISVLKYIDKDWGQLVYDNAPIKYPCALIDIEDVQYTQLSRGWQKAVANITITVANVNLMPSSSMAPGKQDSYETLDLLDDIHQALQLFSGETFQPLQRTKLTKLR